MKKEVFFAIFLGLSLGLIVTYGVYTARRSLSSPTSFLRSNNQATSTESAQVRNSLVIFSPEDESIQSVKEVRISGTTDPEAMTIIFLNNQPNIIKADKSGNFSIQGTVQQGANIILVRTIDGEGNTAEEERVVVYSTTSLEEAPTASASASPSAKPAASVRPRVSPSPSPKAP